MLVIEDFKKLVELSPIPAIDLIMRDSENRVLLGRRKNAPAKNFLFVPGGRIFKGEKFFTAMRRIARSEISIEIDISSIFLKGVYEHIYDDNFFGEFNLSTHYIVSAMQLVIDDRQRESILQDDQHSELLFMPEYQILNSNNVHEYVKSYFVDNPGNGVGCA